MRRIGVISDTHGLMRPQALAALAGCDPIIHAGDVGRPEVLDALRAIAPVYAVRGNVDVGAWARQLPETALVEVEGWRLYVLHDRASLAVDPGVAGLRAVIAGHSHRPLIEMRDGVLHFNPGSAGPPRFRLPITVGILALADDVLDAEIVTIG